MSAEAAVRPATDARYTRSAISRSPGLVRVLGAILLCAVAVPAYRLLSQRETGLAGRATVEIADAYYALFGAGLFALVPAALIGAVFVRDDRLVRAAAFAKAWLLRLSDRSFALLAALVAALLTLAFTQFVLQGLPNHIDSLSQMLHAGFWANGRLAGPRDDLLPFWMTQNSVVTAHGWVSQYPPGHVVLLALGLLLGAPAWVCAALVAILVFTTARFAARLAPDLAVETRVGVLLLVFSPFVICLGGSFMNHVTAAALLSSAAYSLIRARDGAIGWAALAGLLLAWCFATRPLVAVAAGSALVWGVLGPARLRRRGMTAALLVGAAPVLTALFLYNQHFFGSPLRFGYEAALGPSGGLGFHLDPWGNTYGPLEAIAYTSSDLVSLDTALLDMPLPPLLLIAVYLLINRRLERGVATLLAWAIVPVVANLFYWHHGQLMGPRMLYETAPAWLLLSGIAVVRVGRSIPAYHARAPRVALRSAYSAALIFSCALGWFFLAPSRALSYAGHTDSVMRTPLPRVSGRTIVFVHDAWRGRVAMRLAASGMRLDSVEVAVRANPTCTGQQLADATAEGNESLRVALLRRMDFRKRGRDLPPLTEISPGNRAIFASAEPLTAECFRQARSDVRGVIDLAPLVWRGGLVGGSGVRPIFIRDLGPELNRRVLSAYADRAPYLYTLGGEGHPVLMEYEAGMVRLWGAAR